MRLSRYFLPSAACMTMALSASAEMRFECAAVARTQTLASSQRTAGKVVSGTEESEAAFTHWSFLPAFPRK